jgi:hypothetical protein
MNEHNTRQEQAERSSPLSSERGATTISDTVVSKVAGIAALEVEGIEMGGATSRTVGGFLDSWTGSGGPRHAASPWRWVNKRPQSSSRWP